MINLGTGVLICPVCKHPLIKIEKRFACANNHSFDMAKQGYINLLLCDKKKSLNPGDNKEMVQSRLSFLNNQHYLPVANALNTFIEKNLTLTAQHHIADLGCGVGYYLQILKSHLSKVNKTNIVYFGVDISKEAIAYASRYIKDINWVVSSTKNLPFEAQSLDVVMCVFAPSYFDEIVRVLKPQGQVYIITPGDDHLKELKDMLYDEVGASKGDNIIQKSKDYVVLQDSHSITYSLKLNSTNDILNLFKMTPFYWQMPSQKQTQISQLNELTVTVDMKLWCFKLR